MKSYREKIMGYIFTLRTEKTLVPTMLMSATLSGSRERQIKLSFGCPTARTIRLPSQPIQYPIFGEHSPKVRTDL